MIYFNKYKIIYESVSQTLDGHTSKHDRVGLQDTQTGNIVIPTIFCSISRCFDNQKVYRVELDDCFRTHQKTYYNIDTHQCTITLDGDEKPIYKDLDKLRQTMSDDEIKLRYNEDGSMIMSFTEVGSDINVWTISNGRQVTWGTQGFSNTGNQYLIGDDGQLFLPMKMEKIWCPEGDFIPVRYKCDVANPKKISKKTGTYATKRQVRQNYYNLVTGEFVIEDITKPLNMFGLFDDIFYGTMENPLSGDQHHYIVEGHTHLYITPLDIYTYIRSDKHNPKQIQVHTRIGNSYYGYINRFGFIDSQK